VESSLLERIRVSGECDVLGKAVGVKRVKKGSIETNGTRLCFQEDTRMWVFLKECGESGIGGWKPGILWLGGGAGAGGGIFFLSKEGESEMDLIAVRL
jgi:hypothetical protein